MIGRVVISQCVCWLFFCCIILSTSAFPKKTLSPQEYFRQGRKLASKGNVEDAKEMFSHVLVHPKADEEVHTKAFRRYIQLFDSRIDGTLHAAKLFHQNGYRDLALSLAQSILTMDSKYASAYLLLAELADSSSESGKLQTISYLEKALQYGENDAQILHSVAMQLWNFKAWEGSLLLFEKSFAKNTSNYQAAVTAIYLRNFLAIWGVQGSGYIRDMKLLNRITREELQRIENLPDVLHLETASAHPHMTLAFQLPPDLKLRVARTHARAEEALVLRAGLLPIDHTTRLDKYIATSRDPNHRIRIGYVSANIKAKTTVYMAQDIFRFHDRSRFEVHVYATTPPDDAAFTEISMNGVDWRRKIMNSVEYFHDCSSMNVHQLAQLIESHSIMILINWDGYSNNGLRATGLFPLRPAPIQIGHQEYIGSMGARYIDYIITDNVTSPMQYEKYYDEKFIYMPNCFHANSMAYMVPHISPPQYIRSITPQSRGCGGAAASFVYCNFNKHLKFTPTAFTTWLRILQNVPNSVLCLLENPPESIPHLEEFIRGYDDTLLSRVRFQKYMGNPFENQARVGDICNVLLDTKIYNSHTTAVDALWAGVPLVSYRDAVEMGGRVAFSMLTTLGVGELAVENDSEFMRLAIKLASNSSYYTKIRDHIVSTAYQDPPHPLWDLKRYVRNMENGFNQIYDNYLSGAAPRHVYIANAHEYTNKDSNSRESNSISQLLLELAQRATSTKWGGQKTRNNEL